MGEVPSAIKRLFLYQSNGVDPGDFVPRQKIEEGASQDAPFKINISCQKGETRSADTIFICSGTSVDVLKQGLLVMMQAVLPEWSFAPGFYMGQKEYMSE